jgi:diguanylate cyclase (GGDEF)-like protein
MDEHLEPSPDPTQFEQLPPVGGIDPDVAEAANIAHRLLEPAFSDPNGPYFGVARTLPKQEVEASLAEQVIAEVDRNEALSQKIVTIASKSEEYRRLATYDSLTGLLNARSIENKLTAAIDQNEARLTSGEPVSPLVLAYFDLDNFSSVNNDKRLGHHVGDLFLREYAQRVLKATLHREGDTLAVATDSEREEEENTGRKGGDEFLGIIDVGTNENNKRASPETQTVKVVERLRTNWTSFMDRLEDIPDLKSYAPTLRELGLGQSIGTARWEPGMTAADLLQAADRQMYKDKDHNKGKSD